MRKSDTAVVVSGPQGGGKSTWIALRTKGKDVGIMQTNELRGGWLTHNATLSPVLVIQDVGRLTPDGASYLKSLLSCETQMVNKKGQRPTQRPTPRQIYIETQDPGKWQGRRFLHVRVTKLPLNMRIRRALQRLWRKLPWVK